MPSPAVPSPSPFALSSTISFILASGAMCRSSPSPLYLPRPLRPSPFPCPFRFFGCGGSLWAFTSGGLSYSFTPWPPLLRCSPPCWPLPRFQLRHLFFPRPAFPPVFAPCHSHPLAAPSFGHLPSFRRSPTVSLSRQLRSFVAPVSLPPSALPPFSCLSRRLCPGWRPSSCPTPYSVTLAPLSRSPSPLRPLSCPPCYWLSPCFALRFSYIYSEERSHPKLQNQKILVVAEGMLKDNKIWGCKK